MVTISQEMTLEELVSLPPTARWLGPDSKKLEEDRAIARVKLVEQLSAAGTTIEARIEASAARVREGGNTCGLVTARAFLFYSWFYRRDWPIMPEIQAALGLDDARVRAEREQLGREERVGHLIAAPRVLSDLHLGDSTP
jgi:hypothetical protein